MAQIAGLTTTSNAELIHSEQIDQTILEANVKRFIWQGIAYIRDASQGGSGTFRFNQWDDLSVPSGTKTETDEGTAMDITLTPSEVSAGVVYCRTFLSDENKQDSGMTPERGLARHQFLLSKRYNADVLGAFTSFTNSTSNAGSAATVPLFLAALNAFRAQNPVAAEPDPLNPQSLMAFVCQPKVLTDINVDNVSNGGGALVFGAGTALLEAMVGEAYLGTAMGVHWFLGEAPQHDANNWASAFLVAGAGGAVGMPIWWGLKPEQQREGTRAGDELVTTTRYGVGVTVQANARKWITAKA